MPRQEPMTLQEVIEKVASRWQFTEEKYPKMEGCSDDEKRVMAIRHVLIHMLNIEPFRNFIERFEHGEHLSVNDATWRLHETARKMVFNSLRMLELLGETATDFEKWLMPHS